MKTSLLAIAAVVASLSFGAAHASTIIVDLDATQGTGTPGSQTDSATKTFQFDAGTYHVSVIDNLANGGYAGWTYNTGGTYREAFDVSFDGGKTTYSVDVASTNGKFTSYATTADALAAFGAGPYTVYSQVGSAYDGSALFSVPSLDFTLAQSTDVTFGIPDNRFSDNQMAGNPPSGVSLAITQAVPEPGTYALMLAGLGAIGFFGRRRQAA